MSRQLAVKLVAGTTVAGALAVSLAIPAHAVTESTTDSATPAATEEAAPASVEVAPVAPAAPVAPVAKVKKKTAPAKRTEFTIAQLNAGATIRPGSTGEGVAEIQRRLNILGILVKVNGNYNGATASGVARFNEKFRYFEANENKVVNAKTWSMLRSKSRNGDGVPKICKKKAAALCIDKDQKIVRYFKKGKLVEALDARFGGPGYRTREGNFRIFRKVKNDFSTLYKTPMPWSMYFSGGQAVHYSMFFNGVGYNGASHGCVNIRDKKKLIPLWRKVKIGTFAKVYS
ncbi:MAG: L,D-transpeptidase family protein [Candidatus Nanopelagicales bacterium]